MKKLKMDAWEYLAKTMFWEQLDFAHNMKILDFGSGNGATANHFAFDNDVTAIEPSVEMLKNRYTDNKYRQVTGGINELEKLENESFDIIICHNVLEYISDKQAVVREFERLLKPNGVLSVVKHNRAGRIMQMVVLLNNFDHANEILNGGNSGGTYGSIEYYNDDDIPNWCDSFETEQIYGVRTFFDLQQKQKIQKNPEWQKNMLEIEKRVSNIDCFKDIAFFHHILYRKNES